MAAKTKASFNMKQIPLHSGKDRNLAFSFDLDAIFGEMPFSVFKTAYKQNIEITLDNSIAKTFLSDTMIKTNHYIATPNSHSVNIKTLPHVRIGTSKCTGFGNLDVYFVLTKPKISMTELKVRFYENILLSFDEIGFEAPSGMFAAITPIGKKRSAGKGDDLHSNLTIQDFVLIFEKAFTVTFACQSPVIYFETFGNKRNTIMDKVDFKLLSKCIESTFSEKAYTHLCVDLCIGCSLGKGTITLATMELYNAIQLMPNYTPLLCDSILNLNINTTNKVTARPEIAGVFENLLKINCYSAFKYSFDFDDSDGYIFPLSSALILNDFNGHRIYSNTDKFENIYNNYANVLADNRKGVTSGTCIFRNEIRCRLLDGETEITKLKSFLKPEFFAYYDSYSFFEILQSNLNVFIELIKFPEGKREEILTCTANNLSNLAFPINTDIETKCFRNQAEVTEKLRAVSLTNVEVEVLNSKTEILGLENAIKSEELQILRNPETLAYSIIAEYALKTIYIRGSPCNSVLSKQRHDMIINTITVSLDSFVQLKNVKAAIDLVYNNMSIQEKRDLILKQAKYIFPSNSYRKNLILNLISLVFETELVEQSLFIEKMLANYVIETTGLADSKINLLNDESIETSETIYIYRILKKIFVHKNLKIKSTVSKIMFNVFKSRYSISNDDLALAQIIEFMKSMNMNCIFKSTVVHRNNKIRISYEARKREIKQVTGNIVKDTLLALLRKDTGETNTSKDRYLELDEMIRFMHSFYKYRNSSNRIKSAVYDFAYGFFAVREDMWFRNKLRQVGSLFFINGQDGNRYDRENFLNIIKLIKEWSPEQFNYEQRKEYLDLHDITFPESSIKAYKALINIDTESWWKSNVINEINESSAYDVFYGAVMTVDTYFNKTTIIKTWSQTKINSKIPVRLSESFEPINLAEFNLDIEDVDSEEVIEIDEIGEGIHDEHDFFDEVKRDNIAEVIHNTATYICTDYYSNNDMTIRIPGYNIEIKIKNFSLQNETNKSEHNSGILNDKQDLITLKNSFIPNNELTLCVPGYEIGIKVKQNPVVNIVDYRNDLNLNRDSIILPDVRSKKSCKKFSMLFKRNARDKNDESDERNSNELFDVEMINGSDHKALTTRKSFIDNEIILLKFPLLSNFKVYEPNVAAKYDIPESTYISDLSFEDGLNEIQLQQFNSDHDTTNNYDGFDYFGDYDDYPNAHHSIENSIPIDLTESATKSYKKKIFAKYRFKKFRQSESREYLFKENIRPSPEEWKVLIESLVNSNHISKIKIFKTHCYKFNLSIEKTDKFLNYEKVIGILKLALSSHHELTSSEMRRKIRGDSRPAIDEWAEYIKDLVFENVLKVVKTQGKKEFYGLEQ